MIVIVGKPNCPRCDMAKQLCRSKETEFEYKEVFKDIQIEEIEILSGNRVQSVPQIYASKDGLNTYIGSYNELKEYLEVQESKIDLDLL